ncbi:hypothetical protein [Micromonospora violae]|uniref:hypothetical protein n=1 Tax=Micromonospora violae TaxID=1278207 RepID=UPI001ABFFF95|nr:hypothetical protein [Micromonospora violae]
MYGALGLYWSVGGDGFPFAPVDPTRASGSILEGSRPDVVAPVIAVLGLLGAVVAWVMTRHVRPGHLSTALLAIVPASIVALTIIPAGLMLLWTEQARGSWAVWVPSLFWPVWGVALGAAAIAYHRRRRGTCRHCGQGHPAKRPALAEAAGQPPAVRA